MQRYTKLSESKLFHSKKKKKYYHAYKVESCKMLQTASLHASLMLILGKNSFVTGAFCSSNHSFCQKLYVSFVFVRKWQMNTTV